MSLPAGPRAHVATNALHSLIYFAPETEQQLTSVGLKPGRMCYFAGRAAPMGAVSGGVVTATFYNFSPGLVARCIPRAWDLARPEAIDRRPFRGGRRRADPAARPGRHRLRRTSSRWRS